MKTGNIVSWNRERGFGFIETANGRKYFAHIHHWTSDDVPSVGMAVGFELGPGLSPHKPQQAIKIRLLSDIELGADALRAGVR